MFGKLKGISDFYIFLIGAGIVLIVGYSLDLANIKLSQVAINGAGAACFGWLLSKTRKPKSPPASQQEPPATTGPFLTGAQDQDAL